MITNKRRAIVYIDGFNLYYRLREYGQKYKWLDLQKLAENFVNNDTELVEVKFFTARLNGDTEQKYRQNIYLDALKKQCSKVTIIEGYFAKSRKCKFCDAKGNEEKQTDVNIACEILSDCYENNFDIAYLISGDSDLVTPVKKVVSYGRVIIIINAKSNRKIDELSKTATNTLYINKVHLKNSQLPLKIPTKRGFLEKPHHWQT